MLNLRNEFLVGTNETWEERYVGALGFSTYPAGPIHGSEFNKYVIL